MGDWLETPGISASFHSSRFSGTMFILRPHMTRDFTNFLVWWRVRRRKISISEYTSPKFVEGTEYYAEVLGGSAVRRSRKGRWIRMEWTNCTMSSSDLLIKR